VKKENMEKDIFVWVKWFGELAENIGKENQNTFPKLVKQVVEQAGEDESQKIVEFKAYDPFSFFYYLAHKSTTNQRKPFFKSANKIFNINSPLPNFDDINCWVFPTPTNQAYLFYKWKYEKHESELLWGFFQQIISIKSVDELIEKSTNDKFIKDFKKVLRLKGVGVRKLTHTLFLINPNIFFTIEPLKKFVEKLINIEKNIEKGIETEGFLSYLKIMQKIRKSLPEKTPYEIDYYFWENKEIEGLMMTKEIEESIMTKQLQQSTELLTHKKQIILQGSPGTGKTRLAKDIAYYFITKDILSNDENKRQEQLKTLTQSNQVTQKNTNKTDIVFQDYLKDGQKIDTTSGRSFFTIVEITQNHVSIKLKDGAEHNVLKNNILDRLEKKKWTTYNGLDSYESGIAKYIFDNQNEEIVVSENISLNLEQYKLIQFHPAYTYEDFVRGIVATTGSNGNINYDVKNKVLAEMAENAKNNPDNSFVFIIDEINRANLSSVLGELIYALEYRGEVVESMYEYEESREIVLPENLYIIGTMNTADRSVPQFSILQLSLSHKSKHHLFDTLATSALFHIPKPISNYPLKNNYAQSSHHSIQTHQTNAL
jgi:preprotein translocase subunit YajC